MATGDGQSIQSFVIDQGVTWRKASAAIKQRVVEVSLRAHADFHHTSFAFKGESLLPFPRSRYPSSSQPAVVITKIGGMLTI